MNTYNPRKAGDLEDTRAVATAPEKTTTEKVKFSELRDHHQSIPRQIFKKRKKKLPPLIYTVQVQYDDDHDHDHDDHPTL